METAQKIEDYVYTLAKEYLKENIGGEVYKGGERPPANKAEDAVVSLISGSGEQTVSGQVNISVFIPDISNTDNIPVRNTGRCSEVERLLQLMYEDIFVSDTFCDWSKEAIVQSVKKEDSSQYYSQLVMNYKHFNF